MARHIFLMRSRLLVFLPALFVFSLLSIPVKADVGLVLNASLGGHTTEITDQGHSAIYLSRVCPASPVKLRLCTPGEQGSILQNYKHFGEDQPYEWNIVPLSVYLYGVNHIADRPLVASPKLRAALQDRYRAEYLSAVCSSACASNETADWHSEVGASFVREVYIFQVETTLVQDKKFIAEFNARPNVNHYNGITNNCVNFSKRVINMYFPHSTRANYLNDFGMTGPKSIARAQFHALRLEASRVALPCRTVSADSGNVSPQL